MEKTQVITKDTVIGEIIQKWPASVEIMMSYGLHCFGCHVNVFETLEQGVLGHGMSEEVVDNLVKDLNEIAANETKEACQENLCLTELAASKLKELVEKEGKQGYGIRVSAVKGGCAGYTYDMEFDEKQQDGDHVIESRGIRLFVDASSYGMLKDVVIDYAETLQGAGFLFQANVSCGCGRSFQ